MPEKAATQDFQKVLEAISEGKGSSVYLILGEPYLAKDMACELIGRFIPERSEDHQLLTFQGEEASWDQFFYALTTFPFFPGYRVIHLAGVQSLSGAAKSEHLLSKAGLAFQKGDLDQSAHFLHEFLHRQGIAWPAFQKDPVSSILTR